METPEGIELALSVAGPVPRGLAFGLDTAIRLTAEGAAAIALAVTLGEEAAAGPILLMLFAVEWFYPVLFEVFWNGRTPGKASLGLRVVHADGTPVRWHASLVRNLLLAADFLPMAYGFGITSMLCDGRSRRLGDLAAGTLVVHEQPIAFPDLPPSEGTPLAPPVALRLDEQRAVVSFAERSAWWTPARSEELALHASALGGTPAHLRRIAAHLLGRGRGDA